MHFAGALLLELVSAIFNFSVIFSVCQLQN